MKKILSLFVVAIVAITLFGCATAPAAGPQLSPGDEVTMANIDEYLPVENARFIDFRNYDDAMRAGYIAGFELVPFFTYLEDRALVRHDGWNFRPENITPEGEEILLRLFGPKDQVLVGICRLGLRSGYVFEALEYLGWTNLYNAGGYDDYEGRFLVEGDGTWRGVRAIPAGGVTMDNIDNFMSRPGAKYVDFRNAEQFYTDGYIDGFMTKSFFEFIEPQEIVVRSDGWNFSADDVKDDFMLEELFGDPDREIFLMCQSGARSGLMKQALESIGYTNVHNVGGIIDYTGANRVAGDPSFSF